MQLTNKEIREMNELLENVKALNECSVTIFCFKECEEYLKEHLKGCKIVAFSDSDKFEVENSVWIIPDRYGESYEY